MKKWFPCPTSWANSLEFHSLTPRARLLLFCLWSRTTTGKVPKDPKAAQLAAGIPDRPKRIGQALEELHAAGFLEDAGEAFFLTQWREISAKFSPSFRQKRANSRRKDRTIPSTSADYSRARAFPPKGEKKEKPENGPNPRGGGSSFSEELDPRVFEVLEGVK